MCLLPLALYLQRYKDKETRRKIRRIQKKYVYSTMLVDEEIENKEIAKQYKELLRISYLQLTKEDKKLIRLAFNTAVTHTKIKEGSREKLCFSPIAVAKIVASELVLMRHLLQLPYYTTQ